MQKTFPTIGEYNQLFLNLNSNTFQTLSGINIIPSRVVPIKVFLFGSGAYAAVFKGQTNQQLFAIRCFLSGENINPQRNRLIDKYLKGIIADWKIKFDFLENEIKFKQQYLPVLKMEWIEGPMLNDFVSKHLNNNDVLFTLQKQLVLISKSLEKNSIGHGDLQCGNILVIENGNSFTIKLIDYDGMFVPELKGSKSIELGRSEFQHPKRNHGHFNPQIDRFSIWVMLTALEALKYNKSLWLESMQGGYNTLDNFLFVHEDFTNPSGSKLFSILRNISSDSMNYYTEKLKKYCYSSIDEIEYPELYVKPENRNLVIENPSKITLPQSQHILTTKDFYIISSNKPNVSVLSSSFQKLGEAPLKLASKNYQGKTILVSDGLEIKKVELNSYNLKINILFKEELTSKELAPKNITKLSPQIENIKKPPAKIIQKPSSQLEKHILTAKTIEKPSLKVDRPLTTSEKPFKATIQNPSVKLNQHKTTIENEGERIKRLDAYFERTKKLDEKKKVEKKRKTRNIWANVGIIIVLFLISLFGYLYIQASNKNNSESFIQSPTEVTSEGVDINNFDAEKNIRDFIVAEKIRDFSKISPLMSPIINQYYKKSNLTISELKTEYLNVWNFTKDGTNSIKEINKIDQNNYDLITTYEYTDIFKRKSYVIDSKIRFIFNSTGKISSIYALSAEEVSSKSTNSSAQNSDLDTHEYVEKVNAYESKPTNKNPNYTYLDKLPSGGHIIKYNGMYGLTDKSGETITPIFYSHISSTEDNILIAEKNGFLGILNEQGVSLSKFKYVLIGTWSEDLAIVQANNKYGYINKEGVEVIPLEYDEASNFYSGRAKVNYAGNRIYINSTGNFVGKVTKQ